MPTPRKIFIRVSGRIQRRFQSARPGSVLILVVALLVMMALIGTAWITTARTDRQSAGQHSFNTQIDLLVDGVVNMTRGAIVDDAVSGTARPAVSVEGAGYGHYDSFHSDPIIGTRTPMLLRDMEMPYTANEAEYPIAGATPLIGALRRYEVGQFVTFGGAYYVATATHVANGGNGPGVGPWLKLPGAVNNWDDRPVYLALSRMVQFSFEDISGRVTTGVSMNRGVAPFNARTFLFPDTINFAGDPNFPAFIFFHPGTGEMEKVPAADTDGDGIADALLFRLPVGTLNGVDYFAAVRCVDNGSAINAASAYEWNTGYAETGAGELGLHLQGDYFPSNIALRDVLRDSDPMIPSKTVQRQLDALNQYRFTMAWQNDAPMSGTDSYRLPMEERPGPIARTDSIYLTRTDALWMQLGRRLENPGFNESPTVKFGSLAASSGDALAFRGGTLVNPVLKSKLEELIDGSIFGTRVYNGVGSPGAGQTKYAGTADNAAPKPNGLPLPNRVANWYQWNFDYNGHYQGDAAVTPPFKYTPRAILVVRNGVSNEMPVRSAVAVGQPIAPPVTAPTAAGQTVMSPYVGGMTTAPAKAVVNTAGWDPATGTFQPAVAFAELWRAYWAAMAQEWSNADTAAPTSELYRYLQLNPGEYRENPGDAPTALPADWSTNPYTGRSFTLGAPETHGAPTVPSGSQNPAGMFSSTLRAVKAPAAADWNAANPPRLPPDQMVLLRSALAAVNVIDANDHIRTAGDPFVGYPDASVTVMKIPLQRLLGYNPDGTRNMENVVARVYGTEYQPFLTEVYVEADAQARTIPDRAGEAITGLTNPRGYIAIEFYNPYPWPIDIENCKLAAINRSPTAPYPYAINGPGLQLKDTSIVYAADPDDPDPADGAVRLGPPAGALPGVISNMAAPNIYGSPTIIPPRGYLVLENYLAPPDNVPANDPRGTAALFRTPGSGAGGASPVPVQGKVAPAAGNALVNYSYVPNLDRFYNHEMILVRPPLAKWVLTNTDANGDLAVDLNVPTILYGTSSSYPARVAADLTLTPPAPVPANDPNYPVYFAWYQGNLVRNMVPLDSYDFTGLQDPFLNAGTPTFHSHAWHYARGAPPSGVFADHMWEFVYPGRYDANQTGFPLQAAEPVNTQPRQQGTHVAGLLAGGFGFTPAGAPASTNPWDPSSAPYITGVPAPTLNGARLVAEPGRRATYPGANPTQILADDWPGPLPRNAAANRAGFPFGGWAREADLVQIPYMGAYSIETAAEDAVPDDPETPPAPARYFIVEMNSLPMDCSFAEDTDTRNNHVEEAVAGIVYDEPNTYRPEQIGRFAPLAADFHVFGKGKFTSAGTTSSVFDVGRTEGAALIGYQIVITGGQGQGQVRLITAADPATGEMTVSQPWISIPGQNSTYELHNGHYRWTTRLFDFLAAHGPQNDYTPEIGTSPTGPDAVSNDGGFPRNSGRENTAPTHGLININTAPLEVLKTLPFAQRVTDPYLSAQATPPPPTNQFTIDITTHTVTDVTPDADLDNEQIAKAIVAYRDHEIAAGRVPFNSIMDLYRVPEFMAVNDRILQRTDPSPGALPDESDPGDEAGDVSPADLYDRVDNTTGVPPADGVQDRQGDGVRRDFEEQYLLLNRVSNLITTRSDSFTNYILVQGWRGIGTPSPELVVQRRRAFTIDRTPIGPNNKDVPVNYFFND